MKNKTSISLCAFSLFLLAACQPSQQQVPADLVLTNAYIYTVDESQSIAEALAVRGNEIVFVGSSAAAAEYVGEDTDVRDLDGCSPDRGIEISRADGAWALAWSIFREGGLVTKSPSFPHVSQWKKDARPSSLSARCTVPARPDF